MWKRRQGSNGKVEWMENTVEKRARSVQRVNMHRSTAECYCQNTKPAQRFETNQHQ